MSAAAPERAWTPSPEVIDRANVTVFAKELGLGSYDELYRWSIEHRAEFWGRVIERLGIVFAEPPRQILDLTAGVESPQWLTGARLNIVESCFRADAGRLAVVHARDGAIHRVSYGELADTVARVAAGFAAAGLRPGDRVAIALAMNYESVAAYLGIVAAGGVVVSIADSFAPEEIASRLSIGGAETVITQDLIRRAGKELPMYEKVVAAGAARAVVVDTGAGLTLRAADLRWTDFLGAGGEPAPRPADPSDPINVLFSSGTTGDPKAIPWDHTSAIKAAMDGHFHQDIHSDDLVAWPTNLGWMMGPWLIFAPLVNGAALALYDDVPTGVGFGRFVEDAGVTVLGVVPSLVSAWRASRCMEELDWSRIRLFSSTGEASSENDMRYLMALPGGRPVVEYCGGTEIAGSYITGTVVQPAVAAAFSTPALGIELRILDDAGRPARRGEVFLVPPSMGLSTRLLNRDHHDVYFAGTPPADVVLRRHGDEMEDLGGGYFRAHGRADDTMNLAGIKVSSAEIERALQATSGVADIAAVAVPPPGGGPDRLVVYAVAEPGASPDPGELLAAMQLALREHLNPLFKVHDVVVVDGLPRTASNKVMRRELRERYGG